MSKKRVGKKQPTKEIPNVKLELLSKLQNIISIVEKEIDNINKVIPGFFESPLIASVDAQSDLLIETVAQALGVPKDALSWHVYDNDFGAMGNIAVTQGGKEVAIDSNTTFLKFELDLYENA